MKDDSSVEGGAALLHVARAKYLTAYMLLSCATKQLERLAVTRGAYKHTRRSIVRAGAVLMLAIGLLGFGAPRTSHAGPVFAAPVGGAFNTAFVFTDHSMSPALADIDGDGDLDMFVGYFRHTGAQKYQGIAFFENVGTAAAPSFALPTYNPYGLTPSSLGSDSLGSYFHGGPNLVDIDGDADLDLFIQSTGYGVRFFENTGTPVAPAFSSSGVPAGFDVGGYGDADTFVDIDGDGDFDAFHGVADSPSSYITFQENVGTAFVPNFSASVADPYGLVAPDFHPSPVFVDTDGDGDFDAFMGKYDGFLRFQLNIGTPVAASFGVSTGPPFGFGQIAGTYTSKPTFGDIDDDGDVDMFTGVRQTAYDHTLFFYENLEINCGDGIVDPSEACDGANLDGETCVTQGFGDGTLTCAPDCLSLVTTACFGIPCPPSPSVCLAPGKAQFQVKGNADPAKAQLKFKWQKGAMFDHTMLGNPVASTDTTLCIYDETGGVPALVGDVIVPFNAFWVDKDPKGFQLVDKTGTHDGVTKVQLKPNAAGKSSVALQAKGTNLTLPPPISLTEYFDQDTDVTVQLHSEAGICWSASFVAARTTKNDGVQFKAK